MHGNKADLYNIYTRECVHVNIYNYMSEWNSSFISRIFLLNISEVCISHCRPCVSQRMAGKSLQV